MAISRMLVKPHRVARSKMDDSSSNERSSDALKFLNKKNKVNDGTIANFNAGTYRGYRTDRNASKSLDFTFSREITGGKAPSCGAGSRESRVMNSFESRQKK